MLQTYTAGAGADTGGRNLQSTVDIEEWGDDEVTPFVTVIRDPERIVGGPGEPCRHVVQSAVACRFMQQLMIAGAK